MTATDVTDAELQAEADRIQATLNERRNQRTIEEDGTVIPRIISDVDPNTTEVPASLPVPKSAAEVALAEKWPHDVVTYGDEEWEVRAPSQEALGAFAMVSAKYVRPELQNDITGLFIQTHMSDTSYRRMFMRMIDPTDEFSFKEVGALMRTISTLTTSKNKEIPAP